MGESSVSFERRKVIPIEYLTLLRIYRLDVIIVTWMYERTPNRYIHSSYKKGYVWRVQWPCPNPSSFFGNVMFVQLNGACPWVKWTHLLATLLHLLLLLFHLLLLLLRLAHSPHNSQTTRFTRRISAIYCLRMMMGGGRVSRPWPKVYRVGSSPCRRFVVIECFASSSSSSSSYPDNRQQASGGRVTGHSQLNHNRTISVAESLIPIRIVGSFVLETRPERPNWQPIRPSSVNPGEWRARAAIVSKANAVPYMRFLLWISRLPLVPEI